ncbi:MAG: DUF4186 family protein [Alphaproteobacteria bacterium]
MPRISLPNGWLRLSFRTTAERTPMRNHPVFTAQHATATCCRQCFYKWHGVKPGVELSAEQQRYAVSLIMEWLRRQIEK